MKLIPIEDLIIKHENYVSEDFGDSYNILLKLISYAKFLKTPMRFEHFHGPDAVVKIKDVSVLKPSANHKGAVSNSEINLLFVPDEDNDHWRGISSVGEIATFSLLTNHHGVELTELGVKLIFG